MFDRCLFWQFLSEMLKHILQVIVLVLVTAMTEVTSNVGKEKNDDETCKQNSQLVAKNRMSSSSSSLAGGGGRQQSDGERGASDHRLARRLPRRRSDAAHVAGIYIYASHTRTQCFVSLDARENVRLFRFL
jgi:hypothetical protein